MIKLVVVLIVVLLVVYFVLPDRLFAPGKAGPA